MPARKYSRQRESIKAFLLSRYDHPTADTVYMNVREEFPNISLGTVYRNLALLVELGEAVKITTEGADRFDGHVEPHSHFFCRKCRSLLDLNTEDGDLINQRAQACFSGIMERHTVQYYGVCSECMKNI